MVPMRLFAHMPPDRRAARLVMRRRAAAEPALAGRTPAPPSLSPAGIDGLRRLLLDHAPDALAGVVPNERAESELRAAARCLATDVRAAHPGRAERLVIELRGVWTSLPEVRRLRAGGEREGVWYRLIGACIEEFYAPAGPVPPRAAGAAGAVA